MLKTLAVNDARISQAELADAFPKGMPVDLLVNIQDAADPRAARLLVNEHLEAIGKPDDPATTVYGRLLHRHMEAARKDFNGPERAEIHELIERFEMAFPAECKVWDDRYSRHDDVA